MASKQLHKTPFHDSEAEQWLSSLNAILRRKFHDPNLTNPWIAEQFSISERQLIRRVKKYTGIGPRAYLRNYRIDRALEFIKLKKYKSVKNLTLACGFKKVGYFSSKFKLRHGKRPLRVMKDYGVR